MKEKEKSYGGMVFGVHRKRKERKTEKKWGGVELMERNQKRKENRGKSESGVTGGKQRKKSNDEGAAG